jgi:hypothetical protein
MSDYLDKILSRLDDIEKIIFSEVQKIIRESEVRIEKMLDRYLTIIEENNKTFTDNIVNIINKHEMVLQEHAKKIAENEFKIKGVEEEIKKIAQKPTTTEEKSELKKVRIYIIIFLVLNLVVSVGGLFLK